MNLVIFFFFPPDAAAAGPLLTISLLSKFCHEYPVQMKGRIIFYFCSLKIFSDSYGLRRWNALIIFLLFEGCSLSYSYLTEVNSPTNWPALPLGTKSYLVMKHDFISGYLNEDYRISPSPSVLGQGQLGEWATELSPTTVLFPCFTHFKLLGKGKWDAAQTIRIFQCYLAFVCFNIY